MHLYAREHHLDQWIHAYRHPVGAVGGREANDETSYQHLGAPLVAKLFYI